MGSTGAVEMIISAVKMSFWCIEIREALYELYNHFFINMDNINVTDKCGYLFQEAQLYQLLSLLESEQVLQLLL